jgi:hypothetical protein
MQWYKNDYVKLTTIIIGSIVLFTVLSKYQIVASEGYDALAALPAQPAPTANIVTPSLAPLSAGPSGPSAVDNGMEVRGVAGAYAARPKDCFPKDQLNAEELLPKDPYNQWAAVNPDGQGDLQNKNLLSAGYHIGVDTQGSSLRNPSYDLRPAPPNPMYRVSPWGNSTITPQNNTTTMDIVKA